MKKICAWCDKVMTEGSGEPNEAEHVITHGICRTCAKAVLIDLSIPMQEFLDRLDVPILIIKEPPIILTANKKARELLGKELSDIQGYRGGEVIGCAHASSEEGCGRTVHCESCTIRKTVLKTYETGKPCVEVPAFPDIQRFDEVQTYCIRISTENAGDHVLLRIDSIEEHKG